VGAVATKIILHLTINKPTIHKQLTHNKLKMKLTELLESYVTELRNMNTINSDATIKGYCSAVSKFYNENNRIYRMSTGELKEYLSGIRKDWSDSYYNVIGSALKILYTNTLKQPNKMKWFKPLTIRKKYHDIITVNQFKSMMKSVSNIKHKTIIILLYSTGVRLSELLNIKLSDIDWKDNRIFIRTLKNGKNRHVKLHSLTKRYIICYLKKWKPKEYIFEGQDRDAYSKSSVQKIIKKASNGKCHPHKFRHTFITLLIEKENIFATQDQAGHLNPSSTLFYYHIPKDKLKHMYNPLDDVA
jgi:integrase